VIKVHSVKCEKQEKTIAVLSAEKKEKRRKKKNTFSLWSAFVKKILNLEKSRIIVLIYFVVSTKI